MVRLRSVFFVAGLSIVLIGLNPSPLLASSLAGGPPSAGGPPTVSSPPTISSPPSVVSPQTVTSPPILTSGCPAPAMGTGGPAPTSISGPYAVPQTQSDSQMMQVGNGLPATRILCEWVISYPSVSGDPTVTVFVGSPVQASVGTINEFADFGQHGVTCEAYWSLQNSSGAGVAEAMLFGGYCNTDGFVRGEGTVEAINGNLQAGPTVTVAPRFGAWYVSTAFGASILVGQFSFCSENPVGQRNTYSCVQFDAGPFE